MLAMEQNGGTKREHGGGSIRASLEVGARPLRCADYNANQRKMKRGPWGYLLRASRARGGGVKGWRRRPPPTVKGGQWWGSLVVLRPERGAKWYRGGPAMLLVQTAGRGRLPIGGATVAGGFQRQRLDFGAQKGSPGEVYIGDELGMIRKDSSTHSHLILSTNRRFLAWIRRKGKILIHYGPNRIWVESGRATTQHGSIAWGGGAPVSWHDTRWGGARQHRRSQAVDSGVRVGLHYRPA
jgi:hypothetical protein